jgi:5-methylcytosine-specific restriction protein A
MSRALPEWVGKTDDEKVPPRVRARIFARHNGVCHLSERKIMAGEPWDLDHIVALINGGQHRESNLAPVLRDKHRRKTAEDVAEKARVAAIRASHIGANGPPRRQIPGRPLPKGNPRRSATTALSKICNRFGDA